MNTRDILRNSADAVYRLSPRFYYGIRYFAIRHTWPKFNRPTDISEWLLGEMLKPDFARYAPYVDKVLVRDYIEKKGLGHLLPDLYGQWADAGDIPFGQLPQAFALKANNGCGGHIICSDKSSLGEAEVKLHLQKLLKKRFSIREPHYQHIKPLIYAEQLIDFTADGSLPIDYKFHCVRGEVRCILTCANRNLERQTYDLALFDKHWNVMHDGLKAKYNKVIPARPSHLKEMIRYAEILSQDFDFVRVDLYDTGRRVYFGELTFTPASSLLPYFTQKTLNLLRVN